MPNMIDYVKWRSDITFDFSPLNEVDSLIFTEIAYLPFEHFVPDIECGEKTVLSEVADRFFDIYDEDRSIGAIIPGRDIIRLFRTMSKTKRYSDVKMWAYVNEISSDAEKQFSAICFTFDNKKTFIAFRGTDDTLIGWKENLNMALFAPIPAQSNAAEYVTEVMRLTKDKIYLGGHSKGGNLAVYSVFAVNEKLRKRIEAVYNFDGPGFTNDFLDTINDDVTVSKVKNVLPEGSVVGRIFDLVGDYEIVKSYSRGIQQHDGFSWSVLGAEFVQGNEFEKDSDEFHELIKKWVSNMPKEDRNKFVDSFFRIATSSNASTLSDIMDDKFKFIKGVLSSESEDRKVVISGLKSYLKERSTVRGANKAKHYLKKEEDDDDTVIESVYFSPNYKKNK